MEMRMGGALLHPVEIGRLVVAVVPMRHVPKPHIILAGWAGHGFAAHDAMHALVKMRPAFRAADAGLQMLDRRMHFGPPAGRTIGPRLP